MCVHMQQFIKSFFVYIVQYSLIKQINIVYFLLNVYNNGNVPKTIIFNYFRMKSIEFGV